MFDLELFISEYVTKRSVSIFKTDILSNYNILKNNIEGKSVLVIGGAGSIGSSFIKSVLPYKPKELVVVDINENALTELTRDLRSTKNMYVPNEYYSYPIDFSSNVFKKMFLNHKGFDIIANFSAHKHVRTEKDIYSIEALLRNNIINAKKLLDILTIYPPERFFCVSTDKAANPVNIMGASKRIMEDLIFSYSDIFSVTTARFANVAFSNGSLPAGFLSRINNLQPLSAPYDVRRYFVSPEESGEICLLACFLGNNREIYFPKLEKEKMMSFDSIGSELLKTLGFEVIECHSESDAIDMAVDLKKGSKKYPVYYSISDTSGEKPYEEFYTKFEKTDLDKFCSLGIIIDKEIPSKERINSLLFELNEAFSLSNCKKEIIVNILKKYLPNFEHIETGKSLDSKM